MKRIILSAIVLLAISASAFARNTGDINQQVLNSFSKNYSNAKVISVEAKKDIVKITFVIDEQKMFAYYQPDGELVAISRNIIVNQLPINLSASLREKLDNKWLTELFEVSKNGETTYFASLVDADHTIVLKADASGSWGFYKKTKRADK